MSAARPRTFGSLPFQAPLPTRVQARLIFMHRAGATQASIAAALRISTATVSRVLRSRAAGQAVR